MTSTGEPTWQDAAACGTVNELTAWGHANFHADVTDHDTVCHLAANSIQRGAWRNNSKLEGIHAGLYKRPGQKTPRGLSDAEMMVGNIETTCLLRGHLATGDSSWWFAVEDDLFDFDRPYAGIPLTEHVTKRVLNQHRKQVRSNLWIFHCVEQLVGWDRFLLGLAVCDLADGIHWGSPLWPTQVDTWADTTKPAPDSRLVEALKADPRQVPLADLDDAINAGIGYAHGKTQWHQALCGDSRHAVDPALCAFVGICASLMGIPETWLHAIAGKAEAGPES